MPLDAFRSLANASWELLLSRKDVNFEGALMLGRTPRPNYWVLAEFHVDNTSTPLPYDEEWLLKSEQQQGLMPGGDVEASATPTGRHRADPKPRGLVAFKLKLLLTGGSSRETRAPGRGSMVNMSGTT